MFVAALFIITTLKITQISINKYTDKQIVTYCIGKLFSNKEEHTIDICNITSESQNLVSERN